jgi:hypothetical protein
MKVIIAGSRTITDYALVEQAVAESGFPITEVVSGRARGVDALGEQWAVRHHVPIRYFPADWAKHDKGAGPIRNQEMAHYADALILVWDGQSRGSAHMKSVAERRGLIIHVKTCPLDSLR